MLPLRLPCLPRMDGRPDEKSFLLALRQGNGYDAYYWNAVTSDTHKFPVGGDVTIAVEAQCDALPWETHVIDFGNGPKSTNIVISIGYSHHLRSASRTRTTGRYAHPLRRHACRRTKKRLLPLRTVLARTDNELVVAGNPLASPPLPRT